MPDRLRRLTWAVALAVATLVWASVFHLFYRPAETELFPADGVPRDALELARRAAWLWKHPAALDGELSGMRRVNPEWDLMARLFAVLGLCEIMASDESRISEFLPTADAIIDETLRLEARHGFHHFLLPYARTGIWRQQPPRSLFVDGEIALMIAARRLLARRSPRVAERPELRPAMTERIEAMARRMDASPHGSAESYPNECWLFCNSVALAALVAADRLDGSDHGALRRRWVEMARRRLVHGPSGLLVSAYDMDATASQGPEGSCLWLACHFLALVDTPFAREQYLLAKAKLAGSFLGFAYAGEWPPEWKAGADVDSGIPVLGISPASSGLAFLGARAHGDRPFFLGLMTSLRCGGFPVVEEGRRRHRTGNLVGDMTLLYGLGSGRLWTGGRP